MKILNDINDISDIVISLIFPYRYATLARSRELSCPPAQEPNLNVSRPALNVN